MTQLYVEKADPQPKGMILMGSVLLRNTRNITDSGSTIFHRKVPALTLNGEKDGLLRITRGAESYWHQKVNIDQSQKDKFPVLALKGVTHARFMDSSMLPSAVVSTDLTPEIEEQSAYNMVGKAMVSFIGQQDGNKEAVALRSDMETFTDKFMAPLLKGMELEGSYGMKDPCYDSTLVNEDSPKCLRGSPFSKTA